MDYFTVEEETLICIFDVSSRNSCITEMSAALEEFEEPELYEIAENVLRKLNAMSDAEFSALTFNPVYYDEDMEEV